MWALHCTGGINQMHALSLLDDSEEYIRAWTVQLLSEEKKPSATVREKFAQMAKLEKSPVVRLYLACALQRLPHNQRWDILEALSRHSQDREDNNIPRMLWLALESMVLESPQKALSLAASISASPLAGIYSPSSAWRKNSHQFKKASQIKYG